MEYFGKTSIIMQDLVGLSFLWNLHFNISGTFNLISGHVQSVMSGILDLKNLFNINVIEKALVFHALLKY